MDGLRGLALLGMLAWHARLDWIRGGFARMTIFFVLSGYLATVSLLRLRSRGDRWPALRYLQRRTRRLVPLTLVGVAAAIAVTSVAGSVAARRSLAGDVGSVLGSFSNWRFISEARPYSALFESPSSLQHFWSLSAEEQCIWLLPIVLAVALVISKRATWVVVGGVAAGLLCIPVFVTQSPDAVYYGTPNRAGEFLAGAALALWLARPQQLQDTTRRALTVTGPASLVALVIVMAVLDRETTWLYRGGLALMVVPVVGLIAALATHGGLASRALSARPLTIVGRWALSIYVLHWPLYLLLESALPGLTGPLLAVLQIAVAIAAGGVAHALIERPLLPPPIPTTSRDGQHTPSTSRRTRDLIVLPAGAAIAFGLFAIALAVPTPSPVYDFEAAQARANQPANTTQPTSIPSGTAAAAVPSPAQALNVGVFGGSTGVQLGAALFDWASQIPDMQAVPAWSQHGCGFLTNGKYLGRGPDGSLEPNPPDPACNGWEHNWLESAQANHVQVAVVVTGVWETTDWIFEGRDSPSAIVDPDFDEIVRHQITQVLDELNGLGTHVIITTAPNIGPGTSGHARSDRGLPDDHPRRVETYNRILREIASDRDGVTVIDYGSYIDSFESGHSSEWLPDGIHPTDEAARRIWTDYLGPTLHDTIDSTWPQLRGRQDLPPCCDPTKQPDTASERDGSPRESK